MIIIAVEFDTSNLHSLFLSSFTRARHGNPREQMSMQRRNTPPPAVSHLTSATR